MRLAALHLVTLIALLMMPFGMAAAPAAPAADHRASQTMAAEHCPEGAPGDNLGGGPASCAMPCSSALPASPSPAIGLEARGAGPAAPAPQSSLADVLLEIATPPPKRA